MHKINKDFIVQKLGKEATFFDSEESILYTLNQAAFFVFQKIKKGWTKDEIIFFLKKRYPTAERTIEKDVNEIILMFIKKRILLK